MKNTKSLARQAALITAVILGSSAWVSAQSSQGQTTGQYNQGQTSGQYNQGQTTGQYNQGRTMGQTNQGRTTGQYNQGSTTGQTNRGSTTGQYNQGRTTGQTNLGQYNQGQYNEGQPGHPGTQMDRQAGGSTNSQSLQVTEINKGSSLIGATVKNQQGETLGEVRDLVIDFNSGRVAYLVLESDAGVFRSEKLHAVPLRAFQPTADGTSLVLNADKTKIEASAGFDKDNWPAAASGVWGAEPSWKDDSKTTPSWQQRNSDGWNTGSETNKNNTNKLNQGVR